MNASQFQSLARWLVNAISGGLLAYTAAKAPATQSLAAFLSSLITGPDVIAALALGITWLWGHVIHASDSPTTKTPGGGNILALFLVAGLLFGAGCAATPKQIAYRTAGTTIVSVETTMQGWNVYVGTNHPGPKVEAQVKAAYEKYQASMIAACDIGKVYAASGTNSVAAVKINQAFADADQDLADLENLITQFGAKIK